VNFEHCSNENNGSKKGHLKHQDIIKKKVKYILIMPLYTAGKADLMKWSFLVAVSPRNVQICLLLNNVETLNFKQ
jgi:hypothetical protein